MTSQLALDFETAAAAVLTHDLVLPSAEPVLRLRPYQEQALAAVEEAFERGQRRQALSLATGGGKTIIFAELIRRRGGRSLILAHREELIEQAASKLRMVAPGLSVGIVKAERNETWAPVVVGSVQTLQRQARRNRLRGPFATVVADEAHHAAADSWRNILRDVVTDETLLLGVSATWDRADRKHLGDLFHEVVYEKTLLDLILEGYLSDVRAIQVKLKVSFGELRVRKGDFEAGASERLLEQAHAPQYAVEAYRQHAEGRKALLFAPTVASAQAFERGFTDAGYRAASVWGEMPLEERRRILAAFHRGDVQVLCNCAVLTEGYDEPAIDCVIVARPTRSRALYQQMVGRGTRLYPGKEDLLILDLVGATTRHDLVTAATLLGVGEKQLAAKGLVKAKQEEVAKRGGSVGKRSAGVEKHADYLPSARMVAEHVDLFNRRDVHWGTSGGAPTLSLGAGRILTLSEDPAEPGRWVVELVAGGRAQKLVAGLDLSYAMGYAEDYARQHGAAQLVDKDAAWRSKPPSENQKLILRRFGIPAPKTRGEASDLITAALARRRR